MKSRRSPRVADGALAVAFFAIGLVAAELAYGGRALRDPTLLAAKMALWYAFPLALYPALSRLSWRRTFPLGAPSPVALALSVVASASLTGLLMVATVVWMAWLEAVGYEGVGQDVARIQRFVTELLADRPWAGMAALAVLPAFFEEMVFRGILLSSLGSRLRPEAAVVLCGWLFGMVHLAGGGPLQAIVVLYIGVHLGLLVWWTGSLWCSIAGHAVNNLVVLAVTRWAGGDPKSVPVWVLGALPAAAVAYGLAMTGLYLRRARESPLDSCNP